MLSFELFLLLISAYKLFFSKKFANTFQRPHISFDILVTLLIHSFQHLHFFSGSLFLSFTALSLELGGG